MPNEVMANKVPPTEALAPLPEVALSEPDFRTFCAALEASARGRAFLAEYARRNRHADTETVLAALARLDALVRSQSASAEADRIRQELRALLAAMRGAQPVIEASAAAIKAAKLAGLIGFVQHRIESIVAPMREQSALPPEVAALVLMDEKAVEITRSHLAVVPRADEPELPIPAPAAGPQPAIALVHDPEKHVLDPDRGWEPVFGQDHAQTKHVQAVEVAQAEPQVAQVEAEIPPPAPEMIQRSAAIIPEVNLFDGAPAKPAVVEPAVAEPAVAATVVAEIATVAHHTPLIPAQAGIQDSNRRSEDFDTGSPLARGRAAKSAPMETALVTEIAATPLPAVFELTLPPPAVKRPAAPPVDPLAHIMALSDEERIALFS